MVDRFGRSPVLAAVLVLAGVGLSACGEEDENALAPTLETEIPDIRGADDLDDPYVGILDPAFRADLEAYSEQEVTVLADVADVISPRAFTVTSPSGEEVDPVLVVTTADAGDVEPESGEALVIAATPLEGFDAGTVTEELGLDMDTADLDDWDGDVFLLATILEAAP
ncbi:hypothetical protein [Blastococcus tunisiensis]|uniref:Lipoprotein n=1 Tax=Blastococcus tunisiensis TaxID=1798228 RepID=A0A1I2J3Q6_9ACTN|nr:hypothetical protein [Blastococcus sp. DSM 46838]SFF47361.1 hypothetical protein SAMN05216574_114126 [Blastococcus sp. DSM 46838]